MIEILEWTFESGWRFLGVLVLISAIGSAFESMAKGLLIITAALVDWIKNR
jgi:hypothetical protein